MSRTDHTSRIWNALRAAPALALAASFGAGCSDERPEIIQAPLMAVCLDGNIGGSGDWLCGQDRVYECNGHFGTHVDYIYVTTDMFPAEVCAEADLVLSDDGPFATADTVIVLRQRVSGATFEVCTSTLTVVDTTPPEVTAHDLELWPPNHKLHTIAPDDCLDVRDACDPDVAVWFTSVASDEPADELGDGNHEPDIFDAGDAVQLRAERSGTGNGRVYALDWHAEDLWGNWVEGVCHVIVPHDRGDKVSIQDGDAYRVIVQP